MVAALHGPRLTANLWYPRIEGNVSEVEVALVDVRAADSLLIRYDFERDGYQILQASRFAFEEHEDDGPDWQEVAFVPAWQRQRPEERETNP